MKFFGSLFGEDFRNPPKERWNGIIDNIHAGLAASRPPFFANCIKCAKMFPDVVVRNETMSQDIELAITVCQLHLGRLLIASEQYVRPTDGNEFVSMMYSDAARYGGIIKRDEFIHRYFKDDGEEGIKKLVFCADLAKHITGQEPPLVVMTMAGSAVEFLRLFSFLAIAHAFGDKDTLRQVEASLAKLGES